MLRQAQQTKLTTDKGFTNKEYVNSVNYVIMCKN